ncbi:hypothetical protein BGZ57DRAFT_761659, partial [Hyaloscypha finlandica]
IEIKDINSIIIPLYFYTNSRGSKLVPIQVQKGYIIAILYIKRHIFMSFELSIYYKDPRIIKVL